MDARRVWSRASDAGPQHAVDDHAEAQRIAARRHDSRSSSRTWTARCAIARRCRGRVHRPQDQGRRAAGRRPRPDRRMDRDADVRAGPGRLARARRASGRDRAGACRSGTARRARLAPARAPGRRRSAPRWRRSRCRGSPGSSLIVADGRRDRLHHHARARTLRAVSLAADRPRRVRLGDGGDASRCRRARPAGGWSWRSRS